MRVVLKVVYVQRVSAVDTVRFVTIWNAAMMECVRKTLVTAIANVPVDTRATNAKTAFVVVIAMETVSASYVWVHRNAIVSTAFGANNVSRIHVLNFAKMMECA